MPDTAAATIGHNAAPPIVQQIQEELAEAHAALVKRRDDLLAAAERAPKEIGDDDTAGKVGDLIKLIGAAIKASEGARVAAKEPHLEAGRAVDGWFKKITDPLAAAKTQVEKAGNAYLQKKEDVERRRREEEARAAEEAARAAAAAMQTEAQLDQAVAAEATAAKAAEAVQAKPAELSRTRGDFGSVGSLRTNWDFEIVDANAVPRIYLQINEGAIRAAIKAGTREIAGVRIFQKKSGVWR